MKRLLSLLLVAVLLVGGLVLPAAASIVPTPAPTPTTAPTPKPWNTYATSEGPLFADYNVPGTDGLKLMFTPIDLSADGEYSYPLIAAGAREVGQVIVTIKEGILTASLEAYRGVHLTQAVKPTLPQLFFLPDIASAKSAKPTDLQALRLAFDQPLAVEKILAFEDPQVLMYVYALISMDPISAVKPFSFTDEGYLARVETLKALMD